MKNDSRMKDQLSPDWHEGANWMLEAIRASLRDYPNMGGDIEVMKEVERIEREAYERGVDDGIGNQG